MVTQSQIYELLAEDPGKWFASKQIAIKLHCDYKRLARQLKQLDTLDNIELKRYYPRDDTPGLEDIRHVQKMGFIIRINQEAVRVVTRIN